MALTILAGVVLLPPWARLREAQYQRDQLLAGTREAERIIKVNERLLDALPTDPVLAVRLARTQLELIPPHEMLMLEPDSPRAQPMARIKSPAQPTPPRPRLMRIASRLREPRLRRGLLLMAAISMLAGMFLFLPPRRQPSDA
jgi:hypothetical protein